MPKLPSSLVAAVSVLSVPLLGLSLLVGSLSIAGSLGGKRGGADTVQERTVMPASFNENRLLVLRLQYRYYQQCRRHVAQAHTVQDHLLEAANLTAAIQEYNEVAQDTDPSAFASTLLPKRLPNQ